MDGIRAIANVVNNKIDGINILQLMLGDKNVEPRHEFYYYYQQNTLEAVQRELAPVAAQAHAFERVEHRVRRPGPLVVVVPALWRGPELVAAVILPQVYVHLLRQRLDLTRATLREFARLLVDPRRVLERQGQRVDEGTMQPRTP